MYNRASRNKNMIRISLFSTATSILNILIQFVYRTYFIRILSKEYLGIEGLFSNVIQLLSLAELGFGTVIAYRLYKPLSEENDEEVAKLMNFFNKVYKIVALIVCIIGLMLMPFIQYLIKDLNEIPQGINIYWAYGLFLFQSVASYFFTYKQILMIADQRADVVAIFNSGLIIFKSFVQLIILKWTQDYLLMLFISIVLSIILNWIFSIYVTKAYERIFQCKKQLAKTEKKVVFDDIYAMLFHKVGGVVSSSTDNLVLSAFVGLGQLGIYSNYTLIIEAVKKVSMQIVGNFTASIGNAKIKMTASEYISFYERLLKLNFIISDITTVCIYMLINGFMYIWQGNSMILDNSVVAVIVICYFLNSVRLINIAFTNADGLYTRDKARPIIEDIINLVISITLAIKFGIIGVFIGTIVSHLCTVFWREPLIIYRYSLINRVKRYWVLYIKNLLVVLICIIGSKHIIRISCDSVLTWILSALCTVLLSAMILFISYRNEVIWLIQNMAVKRKDR